MPGRIVGTQQDRMIFQRQAGADHLLQRGLQACVRDQIRQSNTAEVLMLQTEAPPKLAIDGGEPPLVVD